MRAESQCSNMSVVLIQYTSNQPIVQTDELVTVN